MTTRQAFSIIVTCYNNQEFVEPCLQSLLEQDYPRTYYEILFIDDGSTDGSGVIASAFQKKCRNLTLYRIKNSGLEKACNFGFKHAQHHFVVRVDVDDMLAPGFLTAMNQVIIDCPSYDFYYCKNYYEYYSENDRRLKKLPEFDKDEIFERGDFFATGTVYRKEVIEEVGYYIEDVKNCGLENYNLILRLLTNGKIGLAVKDALFFYRRHHSNMSTVKRAIIIDYGRELLKSYGRSYTTNQYHPYELILTEPFSNNPDSGVF